MVKMHLEQAKIKHSVVNLFLLIICLLVLIGCDNSGSGTGMFASPVATNSITPTETVKIKESKKPQPNSATLIDRNRELYTLDSGENYVIYRFYNDDDEEDFFYYRIELYNDEGKMIFEDEFNFPEPDIAYVSKDVIEIDIHTGTGFSMVRYCDVKRGLVSKVFDVMHPILFVDGKLIQRGNGPGLTLTVENVFDKTMYNKEFPVDSESYHLEKLQLIDEQTIEIEYLRYDEDGCLDKKTAIIPLSQLQ